jgi:hypothetical protein
VSGLAHGTSLLLGGSVQNLWNSGEPGSGDPVEVELPFVGVLRSTGVSATCGGVGATSGRAVGCAT